MKSDPCRPERADLLEAQGWVSRVALQERKVLVRQFPDSRRQVQIAVPEIGAGEVVHSGVQRPASKSSSAFAPARSNRPARTSSSICRSQASAMNSSNHWENAANSSRESRATADSNSCRLIM